MGVVQKTEGFHTGEYILRELDNQLCREEVTVVPGSDPLPAGTVLALATGGGASGHYVPFNHSGSNGTNVASAILYAGVPASTDPIKAVITARLTVVDGNCLTWTSNPNDGQKAAAIAQLESNSVRSGSNIIVR